MRIAVLFNKNFVGFSVALDSGLRRNDARGEVLSHAEEDCQWLRQYKNGMPVFSLRLTGFGRQVTDMALTLIAANEFLP